MLMLRRVAVSLLMVVLGALLAISIAACSSGPDIDEAFPPGDPVVNADLDADSNADLDDEDVGDNPVLGSTGPGDVAEADDSDYGLLILVGVCLIAAGILLVKVEGWARRHSGDT